MSTPTPIPPGQTVRLEKAALMLRCSVRTLGRWASEGKLKVIRDAGKETRVPLAEVQRLKQERDADFSVDEATECEAKPELMTR